MILDKWQKKVLGIKGNLCLCSPRQMGKSTIISQKVGESAIASKKSIIVIASTERQAYLLFTKILAYIYEKDKKLIAKGKKRDTGELLRPTKTRMNLTNGSVIRCLPTGDDGYGIRGFTIDELYADEAAYIKEDVWAAVTPMLATTGGSINLLSTPAGTEGYFYDCFNSDNFTSIYVDAGEVIKGRPEPQKTNMLEHRKHEELRMTRLQFQQEYLGLFVGGIQKFFPEELIDACCTLSPSLSHSKGEAFQGVDIARLGGDETVLISLNRVNRENLVQFDMEIPEAQILTDTARLIIHKDQQYNYSKIYIDTGGMGIGVYDLLFENEATKRKVVSIDNARTDIDKERGQENYRKTRIDKIHLYNNLKNLMEMGKIQLFDDPRIRQSLRSMQYDTSEGTLKIYGNYAHIAEALKNATWCMKDKHLKLWVRS